MTPRRTRYSGDIKLLLVEGNSDNTVTTEITSSP